ncbi:unnamed protein product [Parascedosporium putredinis]|uniref:RRM domain-containing protein n=1 Tax=Parascedosporium putredinis TaxID=1442378 RepID=A0A9P1GWS4_9PEZI|nr:unnamed protein product [Parascedosporium putredinis]CAI7989875.1 unnamed protein product [Parascedosporium putredinis]
MDWDHEMEEGPGESIAHLVQVPSAVNDCGEPSEDRGSQCSSLVKTKVYIRGLDVLTTEELKSYLLEHSTPPNRIEWIDDTSANLVFESESIAYDAFSSLSTIPITNCTFLNAADGRRMCNDRGTAIVTQLITRVIILRRLDDRKGFGHKII